MALWRVHLRSGSDDPVSICLQQDIIGVGWRVPSKPKDFDEYLKMGDIEYGDTGWYKALNAIGNRMAIGDLVWVRDFAGIYYIGQITGNWEYRDTPDNLMADIINIRQCKLHRVGPSVAGKIINCFRSQASIQQIHDDTAYLFSKIVFNRLTGSSLPIDNSSSADIFSLLSDVDLEDVIGIYLQYYMKFIIIPSSRSRHNNTIKYEYQLLEPNSGELVFVQVKSGGVVINPEDYYAYSGKWFLFSPSGYACSSERPHVICIERQEIEIFINTSRKILPTSITTWMDFLQALSLNKP